MASQHPFPKTVVDGGKFLSTKERKTCLKYCQVDDEITSKRAKALLALDEGYTQVKAGVVSGLTRGQVNYLVTLFRNKGMDLFSQETSVSDTPEKKKTKKSKKKKLIAKKKKKKKNKEQKGKGSKKKKGKKKKKKS